MFFNRYAYARGIMKTYLAGLSNKLIPRLKDDQQIDDLFNDSIYEAMYITVNFITYLSFLRNGANKTIHESDIDDNVEDESNTIQDLTRQAYRSHLDEDSQNKKSNFHSRSPTLFIGLVLAIIGLLSYMIITLLYDHLNPICIILTITPVVYFNYMFIETSRILNTFKYRKVLASIYSYFQQNFIYNLDKTDINSELNLRIGSSVDYLEKLTYVGQMLKKLEIRVIQYTSKMWTFIFYPYLIYTFILMFFKTLLVMDLYKKQDYYYDFFSVALNIKILGIDDKTTNFDSAIEKISNQQIKVQHLLSLLIFVELIIHYYTSLPENVKILPDSYLNEFIEYFASKLDFYLLYSQKKALLKKTRNRETRLALEKVIEDLINGFEALVIEYNIKTAEINNKGDYIIEEMRDVMLEERDLNSSRIIEPEVGFLNRFSRPIDHNNSNLTIVVMTEGVDNTIRFIYLNINKQKFSLSKILNSLSYILRRVACIPLLISQSNSTNVFNILYMIITFLFTFSYIGGRTFERSLMYYLPFISGLMYFQFICDYLSNALSKIEENTSGKFLIWVSDLLKFLVEEDTTNKSGSTGRAVFFALVGVGFAAIIICAKYTFTYMTVIKESPNDGFYEFNKKTISKKEQKRRSMKGVRKSVFTSFDENESSDRRNSSRKSINVKNLEVTANNSKSRRKSSNQSCKIVKETQLDLDYSRWRKSQVKIFDDILKIIFLSIDSFYVSGLIAVSLASAESGSSIIVLIFFLSSMLQRMLKIEKQKSYRMTKVLITGIIYLLFINIFAAQLMSTYNKFFITKDGEESDKTIISFIAFSFILPLLKSISANAVFMLIASLSVLDLLSTDSYADEVKRYENETNLKNQLGTLCYLYDYNDKKLYDRVTLMMAVDNLEEHVDQYLDGKCLKDIKANERYHKTDVAAEIKQAKYDLLPKFYSKFKVFLIGLFERIYDTLRTNSNNSRDQDPLLLLSSICRKNNRLLMDQTIDIEEYIVGKYDKTRSILERVLSFYEKLRRAKDQDFILKQFNKSQDEFTIKYKEHIKHYMNNTRFENVKPMEVSMLFDYDSASLGSSLNSPLGIHRPRNDKNLSGAVSNLFDELVRHRDASDLFNFGENNEDIIMFKLKDKTIVYFHNIKDNLQIKTFGYMEFRLSSLVKMIFSFLSSNIEIIVIVLIISTQMLFGGATNLIITGIILFLILVEEHGYTLLWWEVLNVIFFVQYVVKVLFTSNDLQAMEGVKFILERYRAHFIFLFGYEKQIIDALSQIIITWLIFLLKRQGWGLENKYMLDNPSTCVTRVISITHNIAYC